MTRERTNILFINHSVRDGGPGKSLFYILKYLDRDKINPFVLIPKDDIFSENLRAYDMYKNVIVDRRFPENLFSPLFRSPAIDNLSESSTVIRKLVRLFHAIINVILMAHLVLRSGSIIRDNNIDVIYCNGTIAKIVGTLMGYFNDRGVIWHVRNIQQTGFLSAIINYLSGFENVKKIICVSRATARQFKRSQEKIKVIYNGLDPEAYDPEKTTGCLREEFGIHEDTLIIGSTGRLVPRKGYEQFIRNSTKVFDRAGTANEILFVIIGDTPHFFNLDYMGKLKRLISDLGLDGKFIFTGYRKEIKPYLKDMDIFFIPSNYPDPFPRSVIEAMAYALPVAGFRIGGIAEAFENGKSGFHSEPDDYENMMNNIIKLIDNPDLRSDMGKEARKRVVNNFDAKDISIMIQDTIIETIS